MRILGISGSLRRGSHNRKLLRAAAAAMPPGASFVEWDGLGRRGLEVLVEGGQAREALPLHEVRPGRERVARRPEQPAVVGASAQAAGDAEDPHRG